MEKNHIVSIRLLNFQSWDANSKDLELAGDVVNIIEGANETGKSVLYKVLYNMCFPGYWRADELIRRGCGTALLIIELESDEAVVYTLEHPSNPRRKFNYSYSIISGEGEEFTRTDCPVIPSEIVEKLGLIIDTETKIILNVIDKDVELPFVKTSPKYNASLIRAVVEPSSIADFFSRLNKRLKVADAARRVMHMRAEKAHAAADVLAYQDVDDIRYHKNKIDNILAVAEPACGLFDAVDKLEAVLVDKPLAVKDPSKWACHVQAYDTVQAVSKNLQDMLKLLSMPVTAVANPQSQAKRIELYDSLSQVCGKISSLSSVLASAPKPVSLPDLKAPLAVYDSVKKLCKTQALLYTVLKEGAGLNESIQKIADEIQQIREQAGVCPTCGRLLGGCDD